MSSANGISSARLMASKSCTARVRVPSISNTQCFALRKVTSNPHGSFPILTDPGKPFLGNRGNQLALAIENAATGEATGVTSPRAVHAVEQPVVHAQVAV